MNATIRTVIVAVALVVAAALTGRSVTADNMLQTRQVRALESIAKDIAAVRLVTLGECTPMSVVPKSSQPLPVYDYKSWPNPFE